MIHILPITQAREEFTSLVNRAQKKLEEFVITVNGKPAAILMSVAEYESWKETDEILSDPALLKAIQEGEKDIQMGNFVTLEQLKKELTPHV